MALFLPFVWGVQWVAVDILSRGAVARLRQADDVLLPSPHPRHLAPPSSEPRADPAPPPAASSSRPETAGAARSQARSRPSTEELARSDGPPEGLAFSRELVLELARRRAIPGWSTQPASDGRRAGIEIVDGMPGLGVLPGDRIVAVGGRVTADFSDLTQRVVAALLGGESTLSVTLERSNAGGTWTVPVLVELPELSDEIREKL